MMLKAAKSILKKEQKTDIESWLGVNHDYMTIRDHIAPANIIEEPEYIKFGDNYAKTFVVVDFPSKRRGNWLTDLYRFKENLTISYHMEPTSPTKMIQSLNRSVMDQETRLLSKNSLTPQREIETKQQIQSSRELLSKISNGATSKVFQMHMYLHLQAESLEKLERITKRLQGLLARKGLRAHVPSYETLQGFYSVLPTSTNTLPQWTYRTMDAEAASSLFPFDESEVFHQSGVIKGTNKTTGSLVIVNQYDREILESHSEFVVGRTGKGKTFYMLKDMIRYYMQGVKIFAIDPERQFGTVLKKLGGQVIELSASSNNVINPFEIRSIDNTLLIEEEKGEEVHCLFEKIQNLKIFFKLIKKDMNDLENALLERVLLELYKEKNIDIDTDITNLKHTDFPILEDLYNKIDEEKLPELKQFKQILWTYVYGSNSRLFNGFTNVDLDSDLISFDLKKLNDESDSQQAAMYNVLSFLWDEITTRKGLKRLYVDEAHVLADPNNPRAMYFLYKVYKRIRKYKGGATVATQQISDYLTAIEGNRNYGKAIISGSLCRMILGLDSTDLDDIREKRVMNLSEQEETILLKAKQGEGIYCVNTNRVHIQVDYTPEEMKIIDPERYNELFGYKED